MLYLSKYDMVYRFIIGLEFPLCLGLEHLIEVRSSLFYIVDHAKGIVRAYMETYKGSSKITCHQIMLLVFHVGERILSIEVNFICRLLVLYI